MRFTEEELQGIITDYESGMRPKDLAEKYKRDSGTIIGKLKLLGIFKPTKHRYTEEEIDFVREHYPKGELDIIYAKMPFLTASQLHALCSKYGITADYYRWTDDELKILEKFYYEKSLDELRLMMGDRHTRHAIQTKALRKFGYSKDRSWTDNEIDILREYYPIESVDDVCLRLPNRTRSSIIAKAANIGLSNKFYLETYWSKEDEGFLIDNWKDMSDKELASHFGKNIHAIVDKRGMLGLSRVRHYNEASYENLVKYIRGNIGDWKRDSLIECDYKCVLTGSKDFHIHHLYSLSTILSEAIEENNISLKDNFSDYTKEELSFILSCFIAKQNVYPLGVCLRKDIHVFFHQVYGQAVVPEMWYRFKKDYIEGKYINQVG